MRDISKAFTFFSALLLIVAPATSSAQELAERELSIEFTRHTELTLSLAAEKTLRSIREGHIFEVRFQPDAPRKMAIFFNPERGQFYYNSGLYPMDVILKRAQESCTISAATPSNCVLYGTLAPIPK